jgi:mRNA deadenylase 3'-5' endonuclease subunit Ccr4
MSTSFRFATWNVLATAYIRRDYYPGISAAVLDPRTRIPALVKRATELAGDILCLQEVEREVFHALDSALRPLGYSGLLAMKGDRKPDGCATFYREDRCQLIQEHRLLYADGGDNPDSGHVAQVIALRLSSLRIDLVNTHLKWDPPGTPRDRQWGYRQASLALSALGEWAENGVQLICGDFNVTEDSSVVPLFTSAGFQPAHWDGYTCNSSAVAKRIDYILFRGPVRADPEPLPLIDGRTPLPSAEQPSDHLPLVATFVSELA